MVSTIFSVKQGDVGSSVTATLQDATGAAAVLTGATVRFTMTAVGATVPTVNRQTATIVGATTGQVRYTWQAGDLDGAGPYEAEWEVTYSGGAVQTFPGDSYLRVYVAPDLA